MTPLERREAGQPYVYNDKAILNEQYHYQDELAKYNRTMPSEHEKRAEMLSHLMAEVGENCTIDTPVHANWGLHNVHFGSNIYCNAMVSFVDDADIIHWRLLHDWSGYCVYNSRPSGSPTSS